MRKIGNTVRLMGENGPKGSLNDHFLLDHGVTSETLVPIIGGAKSKWAMPYIVQLPSGYHLSISDRDILEK